MAAQTIDLISAGRDGTLNIHLADDETRAVIGFLSRYTNRRTRANYELDLRQYRNFLTTKAGVPHWPARPSPPSTGRCPRRPDSAASP